MEISRRKSNAYEPTIANFKSLTPVTKRAGFNTCKAAQHAMDRLVRTML
jgi:hypothetical protein